MNANVCEDYQRYTYSYTVYQVPKLHYFSILLKEKGVKSHTSPRPLPLFPLAWNPASNLLDSQRQERAIINNEHIISILTAQSMPSRANPPRHLSSRRSRW